MTVTRRLVSFAVGFAVLALSTQDVPAQNNPTTANAPQRRPSATTPEETPAERAARVERLRTVYQRSPSDWPRPSVDPSVQWTELGLLPDAKVSDNHPNAEAIAKLGKQLFFDPRLSGSGQIACASCHDPDLGWGDGRTASFGHNRIALRRNAPGLLNVGQANSYFWDGRAPSLVAQAEAVLQNPQEMNAEPEVIVARLAAVPEYSEQFAKSFAGEITLRTIATALAGFEGTLVGGRSRFDAFLRGKPDAISDGAVLGLDLFRGKARCMNCHNGPYFSDGKFHNLGLSYYGREREDLGRYRITKEAGDVGKFRTPSLRNIGNTAPYMHNGLFALDGVLAMYNAGMPTLRPKPSQANDPLFPTKSPLLKPLGLNAQELADLKAFLESLTEPRRFIPPPELPGLHTENVQVAK